MPAARDEGAMRWPGWPEGAKWPEDIPALLASGQALGHPNMAALFDAAAGKKVRIHWWFDGSWRPVMWVRVLKDGSVLLGHQPEVGVVPRVGSVRADETGTVTIDLLSAGRQIED